MPGFFKPSVYLIPLSRHTALEVKKKRLTKKQPGGVQAISAGIWAQPWQPHFDCAKWPIASCAWTCNLPECSRQDSTNPLHSPEWGGVPWCNRSFPSYLFSPILLPSQFGLMRRATQILEVLSWFLRDERLRRWEGWETCKRCLQDVKNDVSTEDAKSKGNKHSSFFTALEVQGAQGSSVEKHFEMCVRPCTKGGD